MSPGTRRSALAVVACLAAAAHAQAPGVLSVVAGSPRWELQGNAKPSRVHDRDCLLLDGAAATVKEFEMRDGVIDVDVETPASRGFFGFHFRSVDDGANGE